MIFLLDTSVIRSGSFRRLLEACAAHHHRAEVPALIYAESMFQLRREKGIDFSPTVIRTWFENFQETLFVQSLDLPSAETLAEALFGKFPTDADWKVAKQSAWRRCLGSDAAEAPGNNRGCGGPVDLYVAGLASPSQPIVTSDKGPEWKGWPAGTVIAMDAAVQMAEAA